ncbi:MAG TPA: trehalose-phosphatase [Candidatus Dormibacteraeota bacterium]|nr:trehalose-phosphatase [Candidatus Dormibacteraeota bacterium]
MASVLPERILLVTDFDGTLAPIVPDPDAARPLASSLAALRRLRRRLLGVVILSGRDSRDLARLLPLDGLRLRGDYGLGPPTPEEAAALDRFTDDASALVGRLPGTAVETKAGSVTLHYRGAPELGPRLWEEARAIAEREGLRASQGRLVVEIMPARAGKARALEDEIGARGPGAVIFAGDDTGDRGCFELLAGLSLPHLAVGVASPEAAPGLFDACDVVVDGPPAWAALLSRLAAWAAAPDPEDRGSES